MIDFMLTNNCTVMIFEFDSLHYASDPKYFHAKWEGEISCSSEVNTMIFGNCFKQLSAPLGVEKSVTSTMLASLTP